MLKELKFGNLAEAVHSTVYIVLEKKYEMTTTIVITMHSHHHYDCKFNVVFKTPGQKDCQARRR